MERLPLEPRTGRIRSEILDRTLAVVNVKKIADMPSFSSSCGVPGGRGNRRTMVEDKWSISGRTVVNRPFHPKPPATGAGGSYLIYNSQPLSVVGVWRDDYERFTVR